MTQAPDALLLVTRECPHCGGVLQGLAALVKEGALARLEVVNLNRDPETARRLGVRSVPWLRIGPFELEGAFTEGELRQWAERAGRPEGWAAYLEYLLKRAQRPRVVALVRELPQALAGLIALLADPDTDMGIRLGADSVIEELAGSDALRAQLQALLQLSAHPEARIRTDACHYLGLTGAPEARARLEECARDEDAQVREAAREALARLPAT